MTILDFLPAGQFKHKGGGEWAGPCPRCGGEDRFVVWPEHASRAAGGKFLCRWCAPEGGDGIQFLRDFQDMGFQEACRELGTERHQGAREQRESKRESWKPKAALTPGEAWQNRAAAFLAECSGHIESGPGAEYLQGRGLTLETARRFRIGWNPADRYEAPEAWGLEPWLNAKGNPGKLYLPAGLVLPSFRKPGPVAVKIRRRDWRPGDEWPKYHAVKGGAGGSCLVLGKAGLPVAVVESEIDAFLLAQEVSDLCAVVALGSAANRPDEQTAAFLLSAGRILWALDYDDAGKKVWPWWRENFRGCAIWPPSTGKDLGDMVQAGDSLRLWVEAALLPEGEEEPAATPNPPSWHDICPDYFMGCFTCPDARLENLIGFCGRYDRWGGPLQ